MDWHDWVGNFCYFLLAVSYIVTNIVWLRAIAVIALSLEAVYFYFGSEKPLWVGIFWAVVFVIINLVQLTIISRERLKVKLTDDDRLLQQGVFANLSEVELQRVVKISRWRRVPQGTELTVENRPVAEILILVEGAAVVSSGGRAIATLYAGALIGEISFITKKMATATVTTQQESKVFAVDTVKLEALITKYPEMYRHIHRVVELDLTAKLITETK